MDCPVTQQAFRQMGLDFARIFGEQVAIKANEKSIFDDDEEEQEIVLSEFADESDVDYADWYDDNGTIFEQVP